MTTAPERRTATLSELVAEEIRAVMGRRRMTQAQLARGVGKTEMWVSLRLRGKQPLDMNDMHLIAQELGVAVHDLLPPPDVAARAADPRTTHGYLTVTDALPMHMDRPRDNRPAGRPLVGATIGGSRTAYLSRASRRRRDQ